MDITTNKNILDYIDLIGMIHTVSDFYEPTTCFKNGYCPSIIDLPNGGYSCAYCDYNGYFTWTYPGTDIIGKCNGAHQFTEEKDVIDFIKAVSELPPIVPII